MIHYHGCPLSGDAFTQLAYTGRHAMVSFAATNHMELIAEVSQSFCFDNGAYSAWKSGTPFDINGFAEWVKTWHRHPAFDFYCLPDVIDGDETENRNMRQKWAEIVDLDVFGKGAPVWHFSEPLSVLQEFVNQYQRVCLASGAHSSEGSKQWWSRITEAMDILCDEEGRPIVKIHGLKMLDPTIFSHFPFSSCDSTNVARHCGSDERWKGAYVPPDKKTRAIVMMQRIEAHASAARWSRDSFGQRNFSLFG